jgi:pyrroline-5-carboxylate reductase
MDKKIGIIGGGNIGKSLAIGLVDSGKVKGSDVMVTRRKLKYIEDLTEKGIKIGSDNSLLVQQSDVIVLAVLPQQLNSLLSQLKGTLKSNQIVISVISGVTIENIQDALGQEIKVGRAMPNTAIAIKESMTCISKGDAEVVKIVQDIFDCVGSTIIISEEQMTPATALCACGVAFFLRSIRAASQGGIEIGFHADEALKMAVQTALGAAALLQKNGSHPEQEIDKVTSPKGCTIAGLNEMEHRGFSSALIKGILTSTVKADGLYKE